MNASRVVAFAGVVVFVGCSTGASTVTRSAPAKSLAASARGYAEAYLRGSVRDILRFQGTSCLTRPRDAIDAKGGASIERQANAELDQFREKQARSLGQPLSTITITGVKVRNVSAKKGDAEVTYDLPPERAGNDNWIHYVVEDGQWRIDDCRQPVGGNSGSGSATVPRRP